MHLNFPLFLTLSTMKPLAFTESPKFAGLVELRDSRGERITAYDWNLQFTCLADRVVCDLEMKHGGCGGMCIRFARGGGTTTLNSEGEQDWPENLGDVNLRRARWSALAFSIDGLRSRTWHAHWGGMALFDHPANPAHPTPWLTLKEIGCQHLNANFLRPEPVVLQRTDTLRLRYRVVSFSGKPDPVALSPAYERYCQTMSD